MRLPLYHWHQVVRGESAPSDCPVVQARRATFGDRPQTELGLIRVAELADNEDLRRYAERCRHFGRNDHAAAGEAENRGFGEARDQQTGTEAPASLGPVPKVHVFSLPRVESPAKGYAGSARPDTESYGRGTSTLTPNTRPEPTHLLAVGPKESHD